MTDYFAYHSFQLIGITDLGLWTTALLRGSPPEAIAPTATPAMGSAAMPLSVSCTV